MKTLNSPKNTNMFKKWKMTKMDKKKTFIITLGWTEAPALSSLTKHGLEEGDKILALIPNWEDKGVTTTLANLGAIIEKISPNIQIEKLQIDMRFFEDSVVQISKKIIDEWKKGRKIIFNLSGGMRVLILEAFFAAMLSGIKDIEVELQSENRAFTIEVPMISAQLSQLSKIEKIIVCSIKENSNSISELAKQVKKPISSIYRAAINLERRGLIETSKEGRKRYLRLTSIGKLLAKIQE